jgi:striatin 1/3/4
VNGNGAAAAAGPVPGQEMNLASVLHYLQSEWRRWERDRNEWEIERAEMRVSQIWLGGGIALSKLPRPRHHEHS